MNYFCQKCKNPVPEKRKPCSRCGCEKLEIKGGFMEEIRVHSQVSGKIKDRNSKRPRLEFKQGYSFYKKTRVWHVINRVIDRANNWYKEVIENEKGKIIRNIKEPLSKHRGYGSNKQRT